MSQQRLSLASFSVMLLCSIMQAAPSVVALDTGEQLIGEILPETNGEAVVVRSAVLGDVTVPRARVISIKSKAAQPVPEPAELKPTQPEAEPDVEDEAVPENRATIEKLKKLKAPDDWSGNLRFGINLSQGDRKWSETYARGKLEIDPEKSLSFYRFTGSYTYRQTKKSNGTEFKSTDKYDAEFIYRRDFWEDWFLQNALGYRADQIKGINRELQETVGIGYRYEPSNRFNILFGGGGGVEELDVDREDTRSGLNPVVNVFQEATWRPLERTSFVQKFNYFHNPEDSEQFHYLISAAIRVRLTDLLGFEVSYQKSFDNDVGDGNAQDDTQWRNALVIYF